MVLFKEIILRKENAISGAIKSRAKWISKKYPGLDYDDIIQDGFELVIKLINKNKSEGKQISDEYILKAINNHFHKMVRNEVYRRKKETSMPAFVDYGIPLNFEIEAWQDAEADFDRKYSRNKLKDIIRAGADPNQCLVYELILDGYSSKEISKLVGKSRKTIDRIIKQIKNTARGNI